MEFIARESGTSVATVSRVLNGKPGISEEVRERVSGLLKASSYKRRTPRKKKRPPQLHSVAFVVSDDLFEMIHKGDDFYGRHLVAVQKAVAEAGLYPILVGYHQDLNKDGTLRCVAEGRVQAVIGEKRVVEDIERIAGTFGLPVVLFNRVSPWSPVDSVGTDMHAAAHTTLEYLYKMGHRCIANFRISEPHAGWDDTCFWQQYFSFAKSHNLSLPDSILQPIHFGLDEHPKAASNFVDQILSGRERPTAILSYDFYMPVLVEALTRRGVKIPEEMSLVGFNDTQDARHLPIPLTTYRQDFDAMAQEAVRLIFDRATRPNCPRRLVRIPGRFISRESCVPPSPARQKESVK